MSKKGTGYFLFCGRCGQPEHPTLKPKLTLRLRYLRVDTEGTIYFNCICEVCLGQVEIPWSVEENLRAIEEAGLSEEDINQFRNKLDDGSFWGELGDGND